MIGWWKDSWKMTINEWQMMTVCTDGTINGGANMDMDCTVIG